jgi:hypothetical protein
MKGYSYINDNMGTIIWSDRIQCVIEHTTGDMGNSNRGNEGLGRKITLLEKNNRIHSRKDYRCAIDGIPFSISGIFVRNGPFPICLCPMEYKNGITSTFSSSLNLSD